MLERRARWHLLRRGQFTPSVIVPQAHSPRRHSMADTKGYCAPAWPTPCVLDGAVKRHCDSFALLVGEEQYLRMVRTLVFHDVMRGRDPFLPRVSKRERRALGTQLATRVAAERMASIAAAAEVLAHCEQIMASKEFVGRESAVVEAARNELCTELLDSSSGRAYFAKALRLRAAA